MEENNEIDTRIRARAFGNAVNIERMVQEESIPEESESMPRDKIKSYFIPDSCLQGPLRYHIEKSLEQYQDLD